MIAYPLLLEQFQTLLKENTLKFTKQRELVLNFLYENDGHFTPEDIYTQLKQQNPEINIGIATVYRTLSLLESSQIASSISFGVQGKKYELGLKNTMTTLFVLSVVKSSNSLMKQLNRDKKTSLRNLIFK